MSHSDPKQIKISVSNPKQSSDNNSAAIVDPSHTPIKKLIQFVSIFPNHPNVVCFIFANQSSVPKKFFSLYPSTGNNFQTFGITYIETYINKERTLMVGLDKSFINLVNDKDVQSITQKHLIFMYLLKKFQSVKFVLCFDQNAIKESAFVTVKNTFNRLATIFGFEKRKNYGKSFMMILSHSNEQDIEEIEDMCEAKFKQSIKEESFFKENHNFAQQIINDIFKNQKRSEQRFVRFLTKFTQNQFDQRRESFEKVIQMTKPLQGNQIFDIKEQVNEMLQLKSKKWKSFDSVQNQQHKDNTDSTPLQKFFYLWDHTFSGMLKLISQKMTKGKNNFIDFAKTQAFLIDRPSDKFELNCVEAQQNKSNKNMSKAYQTSYFLSRLMCFLHEDVIEYERIKEKKPQKIKRQFLMEKLKKFFELLYECKVLSSKNEKVIYDFFMVMNELFSLWNDLKKPGPKDKPQHIFFDQNKLMARSLSNNTPVKNLFSNFVKAFNFILNIEFSRIEKGQYVELESMEPSMTKIKEIMNEHLKIKEGFKGFENQSLRKTIARYEKQLRIRKAKKLSDKPLKRIGFTLNFLRKQADLLENRPLLDMFAKSCLDYIRSYKEDKAHSLDIKLKIIELLEFDMAANFRLIGEIYQDEFDKIVEKARTNSRPFDENEARFALQYTNFVIKLGLLEKLREKAHEISVFDKGLSKKMLCRALLMRDSAKSQLEFIKAEAKLKKTPVSAQEEQQRKIDLGIALEAIDILDRHFKKDKFSEEMRLKEEQQLLDI